MTTTSSDRGGSTDPASPQSVEEQPNRGESWAVARAEPRVPSSRVPSITGLHLSPYGARARLSNISKRGILVRSDTRLTPDTSITVIFEGEFSSSPVTARVIRSHVAEIDSMGRLWFEVALLCEQPIPLEGQVVPQAGASSRVEEPPAATKQAPRNRW